MQWIIFPETLVWNVNISDKKIDYVFCVRIFTDCGNLSVISDGSITLQENGNSSFGALADVTCNMGYNAALDIIECLESGIWENTSCDIVGNILSDTIIVL